MKDFLFMLGNKMQCGDSVHVQVLFIMFTESVYWMLTVYMNTLLLEDLILLLLSDTSFYASNEYQDKVI